MKTTYTISEVRTHIGDVTRLVANHQKITITDKGHPTAILMSKDDYEDLEDSLALARLELKRARGEGEPGIPNEKAKRVLLEAAEQGRRNQDAAR